MTRDLNLLRHILLAVDATEGQTSSTDLCQDVDRTALLYHVHMLHEAGYLNVMDTSTTRERRFMVIGLTWNGHEFLDAIRSEARWAQIKERLPIDARAVPVSVVQRYAFQMREDVTEQSDRGPGGLEDNIIWGY